jgi:hypothetical protein
MQIAHFTTFGGCLILSTYQVGFEINIVTHFTRLFLATSKFFKCMILSFTPPPKGKKKEKRS